MSEALFHPTAIISKNARIGANVSIGAYSIIHDDVIIGANAKIESYCELGIKTPLANSTTLEIGQGSVIRSHSIFYQGSTFGERLQTGHGAIVRENTVAGINLQIGSQSDINGDCSFGDYTRLHSNVFVGKKAKIGNFVWLLPYTLLTNDPHPPSDTLLGVTVEDYAILSARVTVLPGVTIRRESLVAASSLVTKDVAAESVVAGVPAKPFCAMNDIKLSTHPDQSAYPWRHHFHRGYPEAIVKQWADEASKKD